MKPFLMRGATASPRRGSALVAAIVVVSVLAVLAGAGLTFQITRNAEASSTKNLLGALYLAEAGISEGIAAVATAKTLQEEVPAAVGSADEPLQRRSGSYWARIEDSGDETFTVTSHGVVGRAERAVEVVIRPVAEGVFHHALFAGNSSEDPNYMLRLAGQGDQADEVVGDIYSRGDIGVFGDSTVDGGVQAGGSVRGTAGVDGVFRHGLDIAGMDYENTADFDVAAMFSRGANWQADDAGGSAWQLAEASPAHIFRMNPDDRSTENSSTEKDDYYLEDPYEAVRIDEDQDGSNAYNITLSGTMTEPGIDGNNKVYFIDGNLWIHNVPTYSFRMKNTDVGGTQVTFVVKGNIMFSDNVFYRNPDSDGVAFIAVDDPDVEDSGNIYFGDPRGGTLEYMDAFMYAENNFYDFNLDEDGSKSVEVNGNMTAGNHVAIDRDYVLPDGTIEHSKLTVNFDPRIALGELRMPGLPSSGGTALYEVASWREIATDRVSGGGAAQPEDDAPQDGGDEESQTPSR